MIELRLMGKEEELKALVAHLRADPAITILADAPSYPCRDSQWLRRKYVKIELTEERKGKP